MKIIEPYMPSVASFSTIVVPVTKRGIALWCLSWLTWRDSTKALLLNGSKLIFLITASEYSSENTWTRKKYSILILTWSCTKLKGRLHATSLIPSTKLLSFPSTDDIAQVVAYAAAKKSLSAVLVYPQPPPHPLDIWIDHYRVRSLTFSLDGDLQQAGEDFLQDLLSPAKCKEMLQ